jgi:hypothetical protein
MVRSLCLVVIVCLLAAGASAHGGTLHPSGPEQNNYIRAKVASCSKWAPASGTLKDSKVQPSAAKLAPVDVKVMPTAAETAKKEIKLRTVRPCSQSTADDLDSNSSSSSSQTGPVWTNSNSHTLRVNHVMKAI